MFKVNNTNTRTTSWYRSGVFINFEHTSQLFSSISIAGFEPRWSNKIQN